MQTQPMPRVGVVIAQLGTPDAPTPRALRIYLAQFLSDRRVIDYSPLLWQPLLRGIILRTRPRRSARLYARIWTPDGSPLMVYSVAQVAGIQERLGPQYRVVLGMSYGTPSIRHAIQTLEAEGITRMVVVPMYPQYSSTTTASVMDAVYQATAGKRTLLRDERKRLVPSLRVVAPFYDDPRYIEAMRQHLQATIDALPAPPDRYIISFHGIPTRYATTGDPYPQHCEVTACLLAEAMGWSDNAWLLTYQSRFGPERWLEPATADTLTALHRQGVERPLVFSLGFVTDCLETLDELGHEGQHQFVKGGGEAAAYHLAPCLNDHAAWLDALAAIVQENAAGWV